MESYATQIDNTHASSTAGTRRLDRPEQTEVRELRPVISGPASGHMVRPFALPASNGREIRLRDYRQRRNLVLFFHHGTQCEPCRMMIATLAAAVPAFRDDQASVLAIGPDSQEAAAAFVAGSDLSFPLLSDPSNRVIAHQGLSVPALIVADQFCEIWAAWEGDTFHTFPTMEAVTEWLAFVQAQCMTCSVREGW